MKAYVGPLLLVACLVFPPPAEAQRESPINTLSQQIAQAAAAGRNEEGLVFAQKLEGLVKRQQGTQNMNYAGVLHNQGMFLHNLGRYSEAAEKLIVPSFRTPRSGGPKSITPVPLMKCCELWIPGSRAVRVPEMTLHLS